LFYHYVVRFSVNASYASLAQAELAGAAKKVKKSCPTFGQLKMREWKIRYGKKRKSEKCMSIEASLIESRTDIVH